MCRCLLSIPADAHGLPVGLNHVGVHIAFVLSLFKSLNPHNFFVRKADADKLSLTLFIARIIFTLHIH